MNFARLGKGVGVFAVSVLAAAQAGAEPGPAPAAGAAENAPDMAQLLKWASSPVVSYVVGGDYMGEQNIMAQPGMARAKVTDRVEFAFDWDQTTLEFVSTPTIANYASTVGAVIETPSCASGRPSGKYEHWTVKAMKAEAGMVTLDVETLYTGGESPEVCGENWKTVAPATDRRPVLWSVPQPVLMAMPPGSGVSKSADGRSLIVEDGGWTWTFTLTPKS